MRLVKAHGTLLRLSVLMLIGVGVAVLSVVAGGTAPRSAHRFVTGNPARLGDAGLRGRHASSVALTTSAVQAVNPSFFSPGACMSFAPTAAARHVTVFLDAGHGGPDPGAVGSTESGQKIYEADLTLAVELETMAMLRSQGFRVVVSRTRDSSVLRLGPGDLSGRLLTVQGSLAEVLARVACANEAHANVLVGVYFDAGAPNNAGCVTGYDAVRPFAAVNFRLAKLLQSDLMAAMNTQGWGIPNEGVQSDAGLGSALDSRALSYGHLVLLGPADPGYVSAPSRMPGAVVEPLFITDPFEGSIAASAQGQRVIASAVAEAIEQNFGYGG